ncbi:IclR family transcriptional regulator [Dactylosporangium fulvum]|uniref:IclR family transcriptional regulator n=1 Tax=Dactylosporangium fulvum TaxID=53359 RepID=A0ABY5W8E6_9ACTN|nr:IclR family transcriptional regulator [Dactylosporangium fulvum]UWP85635.1 IclR family transcriptional regulator [Dactylosporangium fulvum]
MKKDANTPAANEPTAERGSQAIHRALQLLKCFSVERPTVSLTELTRQTGLTMPTVHRMVKALQSSGFLVQDAVTNRYSLGPAVMTLARVMMHRSANEDLVTAAMPHLEELRSITNETVGLHCPTAEARYCVAELVSRQPLRLSTGVGHTYELFIGATGHAILAFSKPETVERVLTRLEHADRRDYPEFEIPTREQIEAELATIRRQGYAMSLGEVVANATAVAAPILSDQGIAVAAVNVTGPADRWTRPLMEQHTSDLIKVARQISARLGYPD